MNIFMVLYILLLEYTHWNILLTYYSSSIYNLTYVVTKFDFGYILCKLIIQLIELYSTVSTW